MLAVFNSLISGFVAAVSIVMLGETYVAKIPRKWWWAAWLDLVWIIMFLFSVLVLDRRFSPIASFLAFSILVTSWCVFVRWMRRHEVAVPPNHSVMAGDRLIFTTSNELTEEEKFWLKQHLEQIADEVNIDVTVLANGWKMAHIPKMKGVVDAAGTQD